MKKLIWGQLHNTKTLLGDALSKDMLDNKVLDQVVMEACSLSGVMFKKIKTSNIVDINKIEVNEELCIVLFIETGNGILNIKNEYFDASINPQFANFIIVSSGTSMHYDLQIPLNAIVIELFGKANTFMGSSVFLTN